MTSRSADFEAFLRDLPADLRDRIHRQFENWPDAPAGDWKFLFLHPEPLNVEQTRVLLHPLDRPGRVDVYGPAGSGKTSLLVRRCLMTLLCGEDPNQILCLVSDLSAVRDLRDRLDTWMDEITPFPAESIRVDTPLGLAWEVLTKNPSDPGANSNRFPFRDELLSGCSSQFLETHPTQNRFDERGQRRAEKPDSSKDSTGTGSTKLTTMEDFLDPDGRGNRFSKIGGETRELKGTDVLETTLALLRIHPVLVNALRNRYRVLLVDDAHRLSGRWEGLLSYLVGVHSRLERYVDSFSELRGSETDWGGGSSARLQLDTTDRLNQFDLLLVKGLYRSILNDTAGISSVRSTSPASPGSRPAVFGAVDGREERDFVLFTIRGMMDRDEVEPDEVAVFYTHDALLPGLLRGWDDALDCWGPDLNSSPGGALRERFQSLLHLITLLIDFRRSGSSSTGVLRDRLAERLREWLRGSGATASQLRRIEQRVPLTTLLIQPDRLETLAIPLRPTVRHHLRESLQEVKSLTDGIQQGRSLLEEWALVRNLLQRNDRPDPVKVRRLREWLNARTDYLDPSDPLSVLGLLIRETRQPLNRQGVALLPVTNSYSGAFEVVFVVGMEQCLLNDGTGSDNRLPGPIQLVYSMLAKARRECVFCYAHHRPEMGEGFRQPASVLRKMPDDLVVHRTPYPTPLLRWAHQLGLRSWFEPYTTD